MRLTSRFIALLENSILTIAKIENDKVDNRDSSKVTNYLSKLKYKFIKNNQKIRPSLANVLSKILTE